MIDVTCQPSVPFEELAEPEAAAARWAVASMLEAGLSARVLEQADATSSA